MEEKLKDILDRYNEHINTYETTVEALESRICFCNEHNFKEEARIARIEYEALQRPIYRFRELYNEVKAVLDAWNS